MHDKENDLKSIGNYGRSDLDGLYYKKEDLVWVIRPNKCDPGLTTAKQGAKPVDRKTISSLKKQLTPTAVKEHRGKNINKTKTRQ